MLYEIVILLIIFVSVILGDIPRPLFDSATEELLPLYTNTYYSAMNVWTGRYIYLDDQTSVTSKSIDILDESFWLMFVPLEYDGVHAYSIRNNYYHIRVNIYLDKKSGTYNLFECQDDNKYCQYVDPCWLIDAYEHDTALRCQLDYNHGTNERLYWQFYSALDKVDNLFNVYASMQNFNYSVPLDEVIKQHKKIDFISPQTFQNCGPVNQSMGFELEHETTETYSLTIDSSFTYSSKFCTKFKIKAEAGAKIFDIGSKVSTSTEIDFEIGIDYKKERTDTWVTKNETKYSSTLNINVPANQCLTCLGIYSFISNLPIQYTANVTVDLEWKDGASLSYEQAQIIARYIFPSEKSINDTSIVFATSGVVTSTLGLDVFVRVDTHGPNCTCSNYTCNIGNYSLIDEQEKFANIKISNTHKSCYLRRIIGYLMTIYEE